MARARIYTYNILPGITSQELHDVLRWSIEIRVSSDPDMSFIYGPGPASGSGLIYPYHISGNYTHTDGLPKPLPSLDFVKTYESIYITTKAPLDLPHLPLAAIKEYVDYPGMIDDLEKIGKVKTKIGTNYMAVDPRRFWFLDEGSTYEGSTYEVDCLGTKLCSDLTKKVEDEWRSSFSR